MNTTWQTLVALTAAILAAAGAASAQGKPEPTKSADLDASACWQGLWQFGTDADELLLRVDARVPELSASCRQAIGGDAIGRFHVALEQGVFGRGRLFADENGPLRDGVLALMDSLNRGIGPDQIVAMIPRGSRIGRLDRVAVLSDGFKDFLDHCGWDKRCDRAILDALGDKEILDAPEWYTAILRTGWLLGGQTAQKALMQAIDQAYLRNGKALAEPQIAALYRPVTERCWAACEPIRTHIEQELARHLYEQPVAGDPGDSRLLSTVEYLALLARHKKANDWCLKLARQSKAGSGRNDRCIMFLDKVIAQSDNPFAELRELVGQDCEFFVYLHALADGRRYGAVWSQPRPWITLITRWPSNEPASVDMLKEFFKPASHDKWTVGLLDTLIEVYYPRDVGNRYRLLEEVLRPIARGSDIPADHAVRRSLLLRVQTGDFPKDWSERWDLACLAGEPARLGQKLPVGDGVQPALRFLRLVCCAAPTWGRVDLAEAHGRLLDHAFTRLFRVSPPDAALDDAMVIEELTALFKDLGQRVRPGAAERLQIARRFWDKVVAEFEAAAKAGRRERLVPILRLMLRICAVLNDVQTVSYLAEQIGQKVFEVAPDSGFRCLSQEQLDRRAAVFAEIAPAIADAVASVRRLPDCTDETADSILDAFTDRLYIPLLRTDRFMAACCRDGEYNPWLALVDCRGDDAGKTAGLRRLLDELGKLPLINSPRQVRQIVTRWCAAVDLTPWTGLRNLPISRNVNMPLVKDLLDQTGGDIKRLGNTGCLDVIETFLLNLDQPDRWIVSCAYDAGGRPVRPETFDRHRVREWLANVVMLHEAIRAPFTSDGETFRAASGCRYDPARGPEFRLDSQRVWRRVGVSGRLRFDLHSTDAQVFGTDGLDDLLHQAELIALLPNRTEHLRTGEETWLDRYRQCKQEVMGKLMARLDRAPAAIDCYRVLRAAARLRYAMGVPPPAPGAEYRKGRDRLLTLAGGEELYRALAYEEVFLRLANPEPTQAATTMTTRLDLLLTMLGGEPDPGGDAVGLNAQLTHRAIYPRTFLARIGPQDVVAFGTIFRLLADASMDRAQDRKDALKVLRALALALPFYAMGPDSAQPLVGRPPASRPDETDRAPGWPDSDRTLDTLILFCQLTADAKDKLIQAIEKEQAAAGESVRAECSLYKALLLDHSHLAVALAGQVFANRDLLRLTLRPRRYVAETIDFRILYSWRVPFELNAAELFDGAVKGCEITHRFLAGPGALSDPDRRVIELLFSGFTFGAAADRPRPSLDQVIRVCARVIGDGRYDSDGDAEIRQAATKFKQQAEQFFQHPPVLVDFGTGSRPAFRSALTYLRVCEIAASRIRDGNWPAWDCSSPAEAAQWEKQSRDRHAQIWQGLLLPQADPPWANAFVRAFCQKPEESTPAGEAAALAKQRQLMLDIAGGEKTPPPGWPDELRYKGLKSTLQALRNANAGGDQRSARFIERYWQTAQRLVHAAQRGRGLAQDEAPYLAKPFLARPDGPARGLTVEQIRDAVSGPADGFFGQLDLPNQWDDRCGDEEELRSLIGPPLGESASGRAASGLGGFAADSRPTSYREAVWQSMSLYLRERLTPSLGRLHQAHQALATQPAIDRQWQQADRDQRLVLQEILRCVQVREAHAGDVQAMVEQSIKDQPSDATARRRGFWAWFVEDEATFQWCCDDVSPRPWSYLAPVWAPFARFSGIGPGGDGRSAGPFEPGLIGCDESAFLSALARPAGEGGADIRLFALTRMLRIARLSERGAAWQVTLSPETARLYEAVGQFFGKDGSVKADAQACASAIEGWTELGTWLPLLEPQRRLEVCRVGDYHMRAIRGEEIEAVRGRLKGLGRVAVDLCAWSARPSAQWVARYQAKVEIARTVGLDLPEAPAADKSVPAGGALVDLARWIARTVGQGLPEAPAADKSVPAAGMLIELALWSEPKLSPFQAVFDEKTGQVVLAMAPPELWPQAIRQLPDEQRQAILKNLHDWALIQRRVGTDGRIELIHAGFTGYLDLLTESDRPAGDADKTGN